MSVISVNGVNKWYGTGLHVLRDIDLEVARGETVVVCGPSGSGKSTLIRTLNALEPFDEGAIAVAGIALGSPAATRAVRRKAGMVFQSFNLFTHFSVLDNLTLAPETLGGATRRTAEDRAHALLARVGLADQAHKFPGQLSGGQQQRVAIARTLMMEPEVLLFDEPTSALDPEMINEVLQLMAALAAEGHTMVCVTHEMGFARNVADRIAFMADGSLLEIAPPDAFFGNPQSAEARAFLAAMPGH
ncbi:amino acid ABC transporter ATP-binding protein [Acuticoccus sp. MNP-M23]|uniref:amino acid ABC transporter ATP-binding protein n=1 Tax=Acuticoccus sp. MNP-M23 TaxID=3072793 RepID=UPI002814E27E|nr:amino acid ABC transporter ATP-binding protein [Acuticoccus sp. MNP-M23]WMS44319.1 amino acid ABC transporter ATP-binding protein [Acuticoccus sp. MNP-M23]